MRRWSDEALLALLDDAPAKAEKLVARRPDLAERLDQLTSMEQPVCQALSKAIAPAPDLQKRVADRIARVGSGRDVLALAIGLFAVPLSTAEVLFQQQATSSPVAPAE